MTISRYRDSVKRSIKGSRKLQLVEIGKSGTMSINYVKAARPPLRTHS